MDYYSTKRLALILAVQAEIEGMKAENTIREHQDLSLAYTGDDFQDRANDLTNLANAHNEQL